MKDKVWLMVYVFLALEAVCTNPLNSWIVGAHSAIFILFIMEAVDRFLKNKKG